MEAEKEKIPKELHEGQCSYYVTNKAKQNTVVTLAQFVAAIRSARWKLQVEEYQRLMAQGDKGKAEVIKKQMPCLVVAGVCQGGHSKVNFQIFSGYLMIDIDHYVGIIRVLLDRLCAFPWVKAGWITISGTGLKLVVRIDAVTQYEYEKVAYPIVANYIARLIDFAVDMNCSDLSRTCYASYDADAFYRETGCEVFPWREEAEALAARGLNPDGTPMVVPVIVEERKQKTDTKASGAAGTEEQGGLVLRFLEAFVEVHPYVPRHRHKFLLALGREASRFGMNQEELDRLVDLAVSRLSMPDCDGPEIRANILDAFGFGEKNKMGEDRRQGFRGHWGHRIPRPAYDVEAEDDELDVDEHNRELRLAAPYFPDWIFDCLPEFFTRALEVAKGRRQRDMLFLAVLANLSGCMPALRMVYDDADVYPHTFVSVIASSASGKGIMAYAARLGEAIQKAFDEENETAQRDSEKAQILWEQERQRAMKEKREPDMKLRPEPVVRKTLLVPADVSRTQLIQLMSGSPHGVILNVSEMDTLRVAVNAEYGRFDDLMRACFHHEMFGSDFKQDKRRFMVYCPKMAFCASGTPGQFYRLCPSTENGSYSRYLIYMAEQDADFRLMAPGGERQNKNKVFRQLSERVLEMYRYLMANPTEVKFTPDQWDYHRTYFQCMLQGMMMEESDGPVSVVFRHGLNTARLAMILTGLRKFEEKWSFYEMKCGEEDFRIAMAVMGVLLRHSLMLSTSFQKQKVSVGAMRNYFSVRRALESLPSEFRYNELIDALVSEGLSKPTAKRARHRLLKMQVIVQEGNVYRFIHHKWRAILEKNKGI